MSEMTVAGPPAALEIASVSPSRFVGARACALREVYYAGRTPSLLPASPAGKLGTVIHRLLEAAGRGSVGATTLDIDQAWVKLVDDVDRQMLGSSLEAHLAPLSQTVADYEVRRLKASAMALEIATARAQYRPATNLAEGIYGTELHVRSSSGRVEGRIDVVVPSPGGPVIKDYKSGVVLGEDGEALPEYATQLRLYAALYAATTGRWPVSLEVIPLTGAAVSVAFDAEQCTRLVDEAEQLLVHVNQLISAARDAEVVQATLASPGLETCRYCPYRPVCSPYLALTREAAPESLPRDFVGRAKRVQMLGNGRFLLVMETRDGEAQIRGLDPSRHPVLNDLAEGSAVGVFGARLEAPPLTLMQGPATTIYLLGGSLEQYADQPGSERPPR